MTKNEIQEIINHIADLQYAYCNNCDSFHKEECSIKRATIKAINLLEKEVTK